MLWRPQKGILRVEDNFGGVGAATLGTSVTTGATSSTKGSWAALIASTAFDSYLVHIIASTYGASATASEGSLDIGIGGAGAEIGLIANLLMGYCGGVGLPKEWLFPLYIPAGTRISARAAGVRTSTAMRVGISCWGGIGVPPFRIGGRVVTYGMSTVPDGTTVTPGASGAEGSWTEIVAATSEDHFALCPSFQASADTTLSGNNLWLDLGIGAAAAEEQIGGPFIFTTTALEAMSGPNPVLPVFYDVRSGSRLVIRASNDGANDTYNGVIHAMS